MSSGQSETNDDGAHRPFLMRCNSCRWSSRNSGLSKDLKPFREIKNACPSCGRPRRFVCPSCGGIVVMRRVPEQ